MAMDGDCEIEPASTHRTAGRLVSGTQREVWLFLCDLEYSSNELRYSVATIYMSNVLTNNKTAFLLFSASLLFSERHSSRAYCLLPVSHGAQLKRSIVCYRCHMVHSRNGRLPFREGVIAQCLAHDSWPTSIRSPVIFEIRLGSLKDS